MSSNYRNEDHLSVINNHLSVPEVRDQALSDFEYHFTNRPMISSTIIGFGMTFRELNAIKRGTSIEYLSIEPKVDEIITKMDTSLKTDDEVEPFDFGELAQDYRPLRELQAFVSNALTGFVKKWDDFFDAAVSSEQRGEEFKKIINEIKTIKNDIYHLENTEFSKTLIKYEFNEPVTSIIQLIDSYNDAKREKDDAEQKFERVSSQLNQLDEDDEGYNDVVDDYYEAEQDMGESQTHFNEEKYLLETESNAMFSNYEQIKKTRQQMEEQIENVMDSFIGAREKAIDFLKCYCPDIGLTQSERAVKAQQNTTELEHFIKSRKEQQNVEVEITIDNQSFHLKNLLIFQDGSVVFKNDEDELFFPLVDEKNGQCVAPDENKKGNKPLRRFVPEEDAFFALQTFLGNVIKHEFRKTPKYQSPFIHFMKEACIEEGYEFSSILNGMDTLKKYEHALTQKDFNASEFDGFESFCDEMDVLIKDHKTEKMINNFFSNKYKPLINDETRQYFRLLVDNDIQKDTIQDQLINKLASYETSDEFNTALRKVSYSLLDWSPDFIKEKNKSANAEIIYEADERMIVEVNDFESCQSLGSQSWCIARSKDFFKQYTNNGHQFIVYDFNKEPNDPESMTGVTVNSHRGMTNAHLKNDAPKTAAQQMENVAVIAMSSDSVGYEVLEQCIEKLSKSPDPNQLPNFIDAHKDMINASSEMRARVYEKLEDVAPEIKVKVKVSQSDLSVPRKNAMKAK